jgi:Ethanolamine utilization protein EutJ (predicted chaperonin)
MDNLTITAANYVTDIEGANSLIRATIDGQELFVPLDPANRHYAEILRQVEAGTLTIQEAD